LFWGYIADVVLNSMGTMQELQDP